MAEPNPDLLTHFRDFLIAGDLVRDPRVEAGDPPEPPFWRQPREGAIAPGEKDGIEADDGLVISAFITDTAPSSVVEDPYWRKDVVTIRLRSAAGAQGNAVWGSKAVLDFEWRMRALLLGDHAGQRDGFEMAGLSVISLQLWRGLSFIGSDDQGFDYSTGYIVQLYT